MLSRGQWLLMLLIWSCLVDLSRTAFMIYALVGLWPTTAHASAAAVAYVSTTPTTSSHGSVCPWISFEGVLCRCPPQFFWNQTACTACRKCERATYQIRACHENRDSVCLHVVLPLLTGITDLWKTYEEGFFRQLTLSRRRKRVRVEASSNVFLENLHSTKNLVTAYYVTDVNQLTDFVWFRDSRIRVNVGLQNIDLMPVYEDVGHHGDNNFMLQTPNSDKEAKHFTDIVEQNCRNPMPDYYNVTLEIYRGRTTKASLEECTRGLCPAEARIGSYFIQRSLNEPCYKLDEHRLESMTQEANSIVCSESNALLQHLFKVPASDVHSIKFSSSVCEESTYKCNQCLERNYCHPTEEDSEFRCCHSDCFLQPDCKRHYSMECSSAPVECARGDAYRYTLIPVYSHLKTQFRCHIRKRQPTILYRLWFYLTIPFNSSIIETPKLYSEVFASDVESLNQGVKVIEFLTIEHKAGTPLADDLIISGLRKDAKNYTVELLNNSHRKQEFKPEWVKDNVLTLSTQFEEPFAYSTSNWIDNNCAKNISKFYQVLNSVPEQVVNVITKATGTSFQYAVLSTEGEAPQLRFSLPANVSILDWWFRDDPSSILFDNTFQANLSFVDDAKTWTIHFSGSVSRCPGYFKVTINDHSELEEIAKYDVLVSCPANFSVSFSFPNIGAKLEKMFEVILNDLSKEHRIFLTKLSPSYRVFETSGHTNQSAVLTGLVAERKFFGATCTIVVVTFTAAVALFCVLVDMLCNISSGLSLWHKSRMQESNAGNLHSCFSAAVLYKVAVFFYVLLKLVYSVIFTFTGISLLFVLLQRDRLFAAMNFKGNLLQHFIDMPQIATAMEVQMNHVIDAQMIYKFHVQEACSEYLEEILTRLRTNDFKLGLNTGKLNFSLEDNSLTVLFMEFTKMKHDHIGNLVRTMFEPFLENLQRNIHLVIKRYQNQLTGAFRNPWLMYVRNLFVKSTHRLQSNISVAANHKSDLPPQLVDFANFLEIYDLEVIHFWQPRFSKWVKAVLDAAFLSTNYSHNLEVIQCSQEKNPLQNDFSDWQKLNSNRYFVSNTYSVSDIHRQHEKSKIFEVQKQNFATHHQIPYHILFNASNPEFFYIPFARSLYSSELDLSYLQMLKLELLLVVLVLDALLLLYKVTVLCMEIKSFHSGEKQADFLCERQGTHLHEDFLTKKKEKVVSFAGLEQNSDDGSKNFHSIQDMYNEVKITDASVYSNSFQNVRGCQKMGSILVMPSKSNISRQDNLNSKLPQLLITLNTMGPYHTVAASAADSESVSTGYCFMSLHCVSYFQLFWQLLRCNDAFPKVILASILFLLSGVALNVTGQNLLPEFLQSFLDLWPYKEVLDNSIHSINRYLQQLIQHSNEELLKWQRDMMTFEFKQLQGIIEFLDTGRADRMKTSSNYICPVRVLLGLSDGACQNSSSQVKPTPTPILPCNFLEIEPNFFSETQLQSAQQNISINLIDKLQNICNLATSFFITLCLVVVFSFIFRVAISAFFRALKMQNLVPVRTFIVAKRGQSFLNCTQSCPPRASPEQVNVTSENRTRSTHNPTVVRAESSDRSTGGAEDSDSIICSHADVPSGASTSSSNLYLAASLRKFSETKV